MAATPKAQGKRTDTQHSNTAVTKLETLESMGFNKMQVQRFETLAAHPEIVAQAKAEARENDTIVTRADVLEMVRKGLKSA